MAITTILGALLILFGISFAIVTLFRKTTHFKNPGWVVGIAIFFGFAVLLSNRITEFTIPNIGTIKAATKQATNDAATISALKKRVEDQSATVDAVAAQAEQAQKLSQASQAQTTKAEQQLATLNKVITDATATLGKLKAEEHIVELIVSAQNDDRHAYDELYKISSEAGSPFSALAGNAWLTIYNARSAPFYESASPLQWRAGVDPAKFSFQDLKTMYARIPASVKPEFLQYILERKDIPKVQKMEFFMEVMKTDPSLGAMEYAGRYFAQEAGLNIKAMALPYFADWWKHHREEFGDMPAGSKPEGGGAPVASPPEK